MERGNRSGTHEPVSRFDIYFCVAKTGDWGQSRRRPASCAPPCAACVAPSRGIRGRGCPSVLGRLQHYPHLEPLLFIFNQQHRPVGLSAPANEAVGIGQTWKFIKVRSIFINRKSNKFKTYTVT